MVESVVTWIVAGCLLIIALTVPVGNDESQGLASPFGTMSGAKLLRKQ